MTKNNYFEANKKRKKEKSGLEKMIQYDQKSIFFKDYLSYRNKIGLSKK